ncbi:AI-2E family transporter [Fumia xinanensis]|uniref:AI-2E family transporter n=1 Tax=Fumia xinanensis TaxID=2763659 RepID=A0A926E1F6_9FIRM|nr:AI-2E family transporter [Fumia xinanensis]MBC8558457.1 AI-2E family transporter [Fumia xinanensis]
MKFDFNRKYNTIAAYTLIVIAIGAAIVIGISNISQVGAFFSKIFSILTPFLWGFAIAYILTPVLKYCERTLGRIFKGKLKPRPRRTLSVIFTYLFALIVLIVFFRIVIPQIAQSFATLASQVPSWMEQLKVIAMELAEKYDLQNIDLNALEATTFDKLLNTLQDMLKNLSTALTSAIPQIIQTTVNVTASVLNVIIGFIISVYMMFSKELFFARIRKLLTALFPEKSVEKMAVVIHQSNDIFSGFISGKILDSFIIGLLCFVFMSIFGWPYAMLISVIVGVTNVIPYFGPFIGAIPSILILLMVEPWTALWFAIFILVLQQIDGNIIGPKILGDSTGLSAFWVIFAITIFGSLMGPLGMFIGVPLFAVIYSLVRQFAEWRLSKKGLPTTTDEYASKEHPIIKK